jgi:hypothetical protein
MGIYKTGTEYIVLTIHYLFSRERLQVTHLYNSVTLYPNSTRIGRYARAINDPHAANKSSGFLRKRDIC